MKQIDEQHIGSRIRIARMSQNMKTKELAEMVGIAPNYLSMMERGLRNPSDEVAKKIANITQTSFDWLQNGTGEQYAPTTSPVMQTALPNMDVRAAPAMAAAAPPNPQFFLILLKWQRPDLFPDGIRTILNVSPDTLDGILAGEVKYEPRWSSAFDYLAQSMNWGTISQEFRKTDAFLRDTALIKLRVLTESINKYLAVNGQAYLRLQGDEVQADLCDLGEVAPTMYTLPYKGHKKSEWFFKVIEAVSDPERSYSREQIENNDMKGMVNDIIGEQAGYLERRESSQISLVFQDVELYNIFENVLSKIRENATMGQGNTSQGRPEWMERLHLHTAESDAIQPPAFSDIDE